jgi:hypothetical protein
LRKIQDLNFLDATCHNLVERVHFPKALLHYYFFASSSLLATEIHVLSFFLASYG